MTELISDGPVERYLDELFDRLSGTGTAGRRSLSEAEEHLRDAVAARVQAGASASDAERDAVASFGTSARVATALQITHRSLGSLIRPLFVAAWWIGITGAIALGISGLISDVLGHTAGAEFVAGDTNGVTYTPARCADFLEYFPNAGSCNQAAALHHWGEVAQGRELLGVLGLIALGIWALMRKSFADPAARPSGVLVALVTTALAGAVALALLGMTVMEMIFGLRTGVGANLADGSVAAVVAVAAAVWGMRRSRRPRVAAR